MKRDAGGDAPKGLPAPRPLSVPPPGAIATRAKLTESSQKLRLLSVAWDIIKFKVAGGAALVKKKIRVFTFLPHSPPRDLVLVSHPQASDSQRRSL